MCAIGLACIFYPCFSSSPGNSSLSLAMLLLTRFIVCSSSDYMFDSPANAANPYFT